MPRSPLPIALAALLALAGCRRGPQLEPLVLVTVDTLRADHVGAYGYPRDTTPFLDRLAAESVLYERVVSASSHTAPSHASLMTSLQPFQHGVLKNGDSLGDENHTLAELLGEAGYDSAAFTSVSFLSEICQGFGHVDSGWRTGDVTVDAALAWLDARPPSEQPFFLWLHLYDAHSLKGKREKLQPDVEFFRGAGAAPRQEFVSYLTKRGVGPDSFYPGEAVLLERYDVYDAGVRFDDRQIERLYRRVEAQYPRARWVVTSDHGEGLGNHQYDDHGKFLYDEQVLVPLIVAGVEESPRRVPDMVRLVDLYPTIAEWIGRGPAPRGAAVQGYPLAARQPTAGELPPRLAFSQRRPKDDSSQRRSWADGDLLALRARDFKYIYSSAGQDELYDLAADPLELANRAGLDPERAAALRRLMLEYLSGAEPGALRRSPGESSEHDAELKALGYL